MIFLVLVYIFFKKRMSLWNWTSMNMVIVHVCVVTAARSPGKRKIEGKGAHTHSKNSRLIAGIPAYLKFAQIGIPKRIIEG